jgi:thiol:disulfide interchange protein
MPRTDWVQDFEQGLTTARQNGRPVFINFTAAWCSWCHQYERNTLSDTRVRATQSNIMSPCWLILTTDRI